MPQPWLPADGRICLRCQVWTTDERAPGQFVPGGRMQLSLVEQFIRSLKQRYRLRELAYDPAFFGRSAQELEHEGVGTVEYAPGGGPMQEAWQSFYQTCVEGRIVHDGDPTLAAHVETACAERSERGLKVRKLKSSSRIDALVACVLAHAGCALRGHRKLLPPGIDWLEWP